MTEYLLLHSRKACKLFNPILAKTVLKCDYIKKVRYNFFDKNRSNLLFGRKTNIILVIKHLFTNIVLSLTEVVVIKTLHCVNVYLIDQDPSNFLIKSEWSNWILLIFSKLHPNLCTACNTERCIPYIYLVV